MARRSAACGSGRSSLPTRDGHLDPARAGDGVLARAAAGGNPDAFAGIYDRYAPSLHDFCCSVLRDRHEARDAVQDTFLIAWQRLAQLREPDKLRAWLFAIARHEAVRRAGRRRRAVPVENVGVERAALDADPADAMSADDASALVWAAADGLAPRDRVLLDLHLRQGLDGQELGDAIGVSAGHAYVLMNRLRAQVERSVGALLVARQGSDECEELRGVLAGWDGTFTPLWRKRVGRHVDDCEVCSERRKVLASPMALLPAMAAVAIPTDLREEVLERIRLVSARRAQQPRGWRGGRGGFPPPMYPEPARRRLVAAAVAAVLLGGVFGAVLGFGGGGDGTELVAIDRTAPTVASPSTVPTAPPSTAAAAEVTTTTRTPAAAAAPSTSPPDTAPPSVSGVAVTPSSFWDQAGQCQPKTVTVTASLADPSGIASAVMLWSFPGSSGSRPMTGSGTYSAALGPFGGVNQPTAVQVTVRATDGAGNVGEGHTTATLAHCLN